MILKIIIFSIYSTERKLGLNDNLRNCHNKRSYSILKCNLFLHIWSDYGDEIVVDKGQKLTKWCPTGKVSQRLSMKERGAKVLKEKKKLKKKGQDDKKDKPKGLYTRESEAQLMLQAMAFNEKVIHSDIK